MTREETSSSPLLRLVVIVIVFVALVFAIKFIWGLVWTVIQWILIGGVALIATMFILSRMGKKRS